MTVTSKTLSPPKLSKTMELQKSPCPQDYQLPHKASDARFFSLRMRTSTLTRFDQLPSPLDYSAGKRIATENQRPLAYQKTQLPPQRTFSPAPLDYSPKILQRNAKQIFMHQRFKDQCTNEYISPEKYHVKPVQPERTILLLSRTKIISNQSVSPGPAYSPKQVELDKKMFLHSKPQPLDDAKNKPGPGKYNVPVLRDGEYRGSNMGVRYNPKTFTF